MSGPTVTLGAYVRRRYAILFYTLLLTFVAMPLLAAFHLRPTVFEILVAASLLFAVVPIRADYTRRVLITFLALVLVGRLFSATFGATFSSINLGMWTLVGLMGAASALRSTLRATAVGSEQIYAALSAYLLAGISMGLLYWVLERLAPGSLYYGGNPTSTFSEADGIYFSFVTLATLGYGDYVPKTEIARGLALLEAVAGQLYLAVMVARLVSLYVSGGAAGKPRGREGS